METNLNFSPFYVGQKVVALRDIGGDIIKGNAYTVAECLRCQRCGTWHVLLVDFPGQGRFDCVHSAGCHQVIRKVAYYGGARAKHFAPIEERFISMQEVIKKEMPLVGAN